MRRLTWKSRFAILLAAGLLLLYGLLRLDIWYASSRSERDDVSERNTSTSTSTPIAEP